MFSHNWWSERSRRRAGFTLIEVIVALAVSGIIVVGARMMLETLGDNAASIAREAARVDARANSDRLLRTLATRLEVGTQQSHPFSGGPAALRFTTWCQTPAGWLERCEALLQFESVDGSAALVAHLTPEEPAGDLGPGRIVLASGFRNGVFRYLNNPGSGGHWLVEWSASVVAPLAFGLIVDDDTTIVRIGERG